MITEQDLEQAIAECQGERNPNANTCIKLAAFYTIRNELYGKQAPVSDPLPVYSMLPAPATPIVNTNIIDYSGDSEFAKTIHGRNAAEIWEVMDELMQTLQLIEPRLYTSVMQKLY